MEQTKEITLKVNLTAKKVYALLVLALMLWRPALLDSAQTMTMTSYYPAPYGGYYQLVSKSTTYLADTAWTSMYANRNGGYTYIGKNATRSAGGSYMYQYGYGYLGMISDNSTTPTEANAFGATHIGYQSGQVYVGYNNSYSQATSATSYSGLFSNVPLATNKHIYIGSAGGATQKKSLKAINSSSIYSNDVKLLVDLDGYSNTSDGGPVGVVVAKGYYSSFLNVDVAEGSYGYEAVLGGGRYTRMRLMSDGYPAVTGDTGLPLYITVHGKLTVQGDIVLGNWSNGSTSKTKIQNLCYQKRYLTGTTSCKTGYVAIGFLPHNNMSDDSKIVTDGNAYNSGSYSGNPMIYTQDTRFSAQGYLTCCALSLPIEY
jgi:hypothetical protein